MVREMLRLINIQIHSLFQAIFTIILILALVYSVSARLNTGVTDFSVMNYGAIGDGKADDTQALLKAWEATCNASRGTPTMIIPKGKTFLVKTLSFYGPCKSTNVYFLVSGIIEAPTRALPDSETWIAFHHVNGLTVGGSGTINGRGYDWWTKSCKRNPKSGCTTVAPTTLTFFYATDVRISDIKFLDSGGVHLKIDDGLRVNVSNLQIRAPGTSPNTDGIHIGRSQHVSIQNSVISTGDDCISIGDQTSDIDIAQIVCGLGHGISVGSLGKGGLSDVAVERIHVKNSKFYGTTNGARIKTWQGASGYARGITFENLMFNSVENPIIIDQYYCDTPTKDCKNQTRGVQISDIKYMGVWGTSETETAIKLKCSMSVACKDLLLSNVTLKSVGGNRTTSYCLNAHGIADKVAPDVPCLSG